MTAEDASQEIAKLVKDQVRPTYNENTVRANIQLTQT